MVSESKAQTQKLAAKLVKTLLLERLPVLHRGIRARKILKAYVVPRQARELLFPERSRRAIIIALSGELGSGKTTFTQGFMKALGVEHHITSPTFIVFRKYSIKGGRTSQILRFKKYPEVRPPKIESRFAYHFDLYRLDKPQDVLKLGFKKIINNPQNIVLIEWPEIIKKQLPKNTIWVYFSHNKKLNERKIILSLPKD